MIGYYSSQAKNMPYIALNEFDNEVTSFQCLDEYLREGVEYTSFRCAFCEVPYVAKSIYGEREAARAPHFAIKQNSKHQGDCDGEPLAVDVELLTNQPIRKVTKRKYELPEKLVAKPPPRVTRFKPPEGERKIPSSEEIRRRRTVAGREYGTARYTSSLLQSFIDAKRFLVSECYKEARVAKITEPAKIKALLKSTTTSYPLQLFEQPLNYDNAFWGANNPRNGDARIFHARYGVVSVTNVGFTITSEAPDVESKGPHSPEKKTKRTAIVDFALSNAPTPLPRAHKKMLDQLREAEKEGAKVAWHAYGKMDAKDNQNLIVLARQDHLHIVFEDPL